MALSQIIYQMSRGTVLTVSLFLITLTLSMPLGLVVTFFYISKNNFLSKITGFYVLVMRGTPLLLQVFFVYFGLPYLPYIGKYLVLDRFPACAIAFVFNYAAYFSEIFRGGLLAVDKGQHEAAKVLGISKTQALFKIVMPQMFRVCLPAISNETISLVKDTSLIAIIGVSELLQITRGIVNKTASVMPFAVAGLFYLTMSYLITIVLKKIENKIAYD